MPTNKNAQLRYKILDECFANRYKTFGIQDLIEVCSDRLSEYYGEEIRISRRTIYEDIRFMESADGFDAPITHIKEGKNVYFRYEDPHFSILKKELSAPEKEVITNALSIFARIKKLQGFDWDRKRETEIDFIAVNEIEKSIDFAEIKRQKNNISIEKLRQKATEFLIQNPQFNSYKKEFYEWSLEDM